MNTKIITTLAAAGFLAATALTGAPAGAHAVGASDVAQCTNGDLKASYHARDAATSHRYGVIKLKNVSDAACSTGGYGGLSYVGHGDGTQVGHAADRDPGKVRTIVLQPGEAAKSLVSETVAGVYPKKQCKPTHVDGFRVYVPNSTESQYVVHPTTGCSKYGVHLISHKPLR